MTTHIEALEAKLAEAIESLSWTEQKLQMDRGLPGRGAALKAARTRTQKKIAELKGRIAAHKRRLNA